MVYIIILVPHLNQNHMAFTMGTSDCFVSMILERMDILWMFSEACACKKYFKIQSTGGSTCSWFLKTSGDSYPCPVTITGGASGGGFTSTCSIPDTCCAILFKINR